MRFILIFLLFFSTQAFSQWKEYIIGVKGDTLNATDLKGQKQGKWIIRYDEIRGEPGYEEEGEYKNNRKEGTWRRYSLQGDLIAIENFRWGNKDGILQYFTKQGELMREESWRAINPDKQYDTIDVEDIDNLGNYKSVIIKNEGAGIKHGTWKFYDPSRGTVMKTETYVLGKLDTGNKDANATTTTTTETKTKAKPKEVLEFEKKNAGKKKIKVRDGSTL